MRKISRRRFLKTAGAVAVMGSMLSAGAASASACFDAMPEEGYPQTVVIGGYEWGPAVTATIIQLDKTVRPSSVEAADFVVTESKESFDWATFSAEHVVSSAPRKVVEAYTCTSKGARTNLPSRYVRLEMSYDPNTGSPFCYDVITGKNTWCDPYELKVELAAGASLTTALGALVTSLKVDPVIDYTAAQIPELDAFKTDGVFTGTDGKTLTYAYYQPMNLTGKKLPLVIWLHGAGEGGENPSILLLGNEVTPLAEKEFQDAMGGAAYILTPQTPTFWLEYGDAGEWGNNPGVPSVYTQVLKELIDNFVATHTDIDPNRIIIGGCSNGGYMTVNMVLRYPDYFAAAYPICEAYKDSGISDAELEAIRDLPIWFIYAENDTTVLPEVYEAPTIARLKAMNAPNLRTSIYADVHDTTGKYVGEDGAPYQYMGHWSWVYFFQNQCADDVTGENMWTWMGKQSK